MEEVDYDQEDNENKKSGGSSQGKIKKKGRGHNCEKSDEDKYNGRGGVFEKIETDGKGPGPSQSIEGWIVFATNVHQEAQEEDILDKFSEFGDVKNIHVNLDRRTGFVKGYALVEFEHYNDALSAIKGLNGKPLLGQNINVSWAFSKK